MTDVLAHLAEFVKGLPRSPGDDWVVSEAGPDAQHAAARSARTLLHAELDPGYLRLASMADRLAMDGSWIYSVFPQDDFVTSDWRDNPEIVDQNLAWRMTGIFTPAEGWIIYGWGESLFLVQNLYTREFETRARDSWGTILDRVKTFPEGVAALFRIPLVP